MGLDSKELSLDLNCCFSSPNSFSDLLTDLSSIDDIPRKLSALNDYVYFLEQELRKVDVFKRELPLSMILLNDAIEKLKEEALQLKRRGLEGVVKEKFLSLKGNSVEESGAQVSDKKDWMSSAQLWTTPVLYENSFDASRVPDSVPLQHTRCKETEDSTRSRSLFEAGNLSKKGGIKREVTEDLGVDGLSLCIPTAEMGSKVDKSLRGKMAPSLDYGIAEDSSCQQQSKKQRRCWSQELHQSFVNALLQLGGAQAATPKQIREIMQVDGLTNDEVKSHLQKYRLHIRKLQPSPADALGNMEQWLKMDGSKHMPLPLSGSPEGPLHLGGGGGGGSAKGVSASATVGESVDEEEDSKSESQSWKGRFCKAT